MLMTIPNWLNHSLDISGKTSGTIKEIVLFDVLPWAFYSIFVLAKNLLSKEIRKSSFTQLVLAIVLIISGLVFSIYTINKQKHNNSYSKAISILAAAIYATLFLLGLINWRLL